MSRIKANEVYENRYYRIPKIFFKESKYKDMSLDAKVLYGFLDDRRELSLKNSWINEKGEIYLIYTRKDIQDMLCLSDKPVTRAFKELQAYGLIEEERQGLNKPNLIYICHIDYENLEFMRIRKNSDSRNGDKTNQESDILRRNDTNYNHTDLNEPDNNDNGSSGTVKYSSLSSIVLKEYMTSYQQYCGDNHPNLKPKQVERIYQVITKFENETDLMLSDWKAMIERHFNTDYGESVDYNANHFFTEGILRNRYYEELY